MFYTIATLVIKNANLRRTNPLAVHSEIRLLSGMIIGMALSLLMFFVGTLVWAVQYGIETVEGYLIVELVTLMSMTTLLEVLRVSTEISSQQVRDFLVSLRSDIAQ